MVIPRSLSSIIILNKSQGANPMMIPCTRPPAGAAWLCFSIISGGGRVAGRTGGRAGALDVHAGAHGAGGQSL